MTPTSSGPTWSGLFAVLDDAAEEWAEWTAGKVPTTYAHERGVGAQEALHELRERLEAMRDHCPGCE